MLSRIHNEVHEQHGRHIVTDLRKGLVLLGIHSDGVSRGLEEAWSRPVRHNWKVESRALYSTMSLDRRATVTLQTMDLLEPYVTARDRAQIMAASLVVPHVLPFDDANLDQLRLIARMHPGRLVADHREGRSADSTVLSPLVEQWNNWLWPPGTAGRNRISDDHGNASILYSAAQSLSSLLPRVLEQWPSDTA